MPTIGLGGWSFEAVPYLGAPPNAYTVPFEVASQYACFVGGSDVSVVVAAIFGTGLDGCDAAGGVAVTGAVVGVVVVVLGVDVVDDLAGAVVAVVEPLDCCDVDGAVAAPEGVAAMAKHSAPVARNDAAAIVLFGLANVRCFSEVTRPPVRARPCVFFVLMSPRCRRVRFGRSDPNARAPAGTRRTVACSDACAPRRGWIQRRARVPSTVTRPLRRPLKQTHGSRLGCRGVLRRSTLQNVQTKSERAGQRHDRESFRVRLVVRDPLNRRFGTGRW